VKRSSGLLLHPTSLPSPYCIGDLGPCARAFADDLARAGQRWWQMLPIGPTGMGDSPYNALSAFAGNPLLISPEDMVSDGHLTKEELASISFSNSRRADFSCAKQLKNDCLRMAFRRFEPSAAFQSFCEKQKSWLEPYVYFIALKNSNDERAWVDWRNTNQNDPAIREEALFHKFTQFIFFEQWARLHAHCKEKGVGLIGDLPIYVAHDSADVWAHRELFYLKKDGRPSFVAGTPPDYFSKTGQWWGNPLYQWNVHKQTRYAWWSERLHHMLTLFDAVRLDHFIGFRRYWRIDARHTTAEKGKWVRGPGAHFFKTVLSKPEQAKFIAEDLGATGPDVDKLRDQFGFPGMRVLHFSFEKNGLPAFKENSVVYSGTHDNDTTQGWFESLPAAQQRHVMRVMDGSKKTIHWDLVRTGLACDASLVVFPVQDILGLGSIARMNTPGVQDGNWSWRLKPGELKGAHLHKLKKLTGDYERR
jgi:4-alpha-glucanotransferase